MKYWFYFWTALFILAASTFAGIALVVLVRGIGDLPRMFQRLRKTQDL